MEEHIKIAIVDDHTLFRNGLSALLKEFENIQVVFEANNGLHMQEMLKNHALPDVVLMDINMHIMEGYAATKWLKDNYPQLKVLALSMFEEDKAVIGMIKNGASGYVLKESKPSEVWAAIVAIYTKGSYLNELVSGKLIHSISNPLAAPRFSKNELEFLKLCCSEHTYKEIADLLFVSPRTVDNYREALFSKLNIKSRTGLVLYAIKNGLVAL